MYEFVGGYKLAPNFKCDRWIQASSIAPQSPKSSPFFFFTKKFFFYKIFFKLKMSILDFRKGIIIIEIVNFKSLK